MISVEVTQSDIDQGEKQACEHCPIAIAVRRASGGYPWVGRFFISVTTAEGHVEYATPHSVYDFIDRFDEAGKIAVEPFGFELSTRAEREASA